MQKFKLLAIFFIGALLLSSCGEYQRVLNKGTSEEQYKMATKLYETKQFSKALRLFEKVTPVYRGKPQMERIQYMVAQSNFNTKNYTLSGYYFDRFTQNYPNSSKKEEAAFLSAYSYKLASPRYSVDQTDTKKALLAFQQFINDYPTSLRLDEANKHYKELRFKLETKDFEIAKTYYRTAAVDYRNYRAAITAFENLLGEYLGTSYKEEALFYIFKAYHDYVLISFDAKKVERIKEAMTAYERLVNTFPKTKHIKEVNEMLQTLKEQEQKLAKS